MNKLYLNLLLILSSIIPLLVHALPIDSTTSADQNFSLKADNTSLIRRAHDISIGGSLKISAVNLASGDTTDLILKRFDVFAPNAKIIVDGNGNIPPPSSAYFRGYTTTMPQAIVVLTVPDNGPAHGLVTDKSGVWTLSETGDNGSNSKLTNRKIDVTSIPTNHQFECATESLPVPYKTWLHTNFKSNPALSPTITYTARVAVETDYEYFAEFGNTTDALSYMGDLFAYASAVYERELNTNLVISYTKLWPNGASTDPWQASNSSSALYEFKNYWDRNNTDINRTIVHMLSGRNLGGGIAYLEGLCNSSGYGISGDIEHSFDTSSPSVVWDVVVLAHEIGHNFGADHTQNYCNTAGISDPVDLCYDSANSCGSALGLPGVDSLTGGSPGSGNGTIMSYCHLRSGGMANITYTFGLNHIYGRAAWRVPNLMQSYIATTAAANPTCLALQNNSPSIVQSPATNISTNAATLRATVNDNGLDTSVIFEFGPTTSYGINVIPTPNTISSGSGGTAVAARKTGLTCNTSYHYRTKATNSAGSTYGNDQLFTTLACPFTVSPSANIGGMVNPNTPQSIVLGTTASFDVTSKSGYIINSKQVGGTCPLGGWSGNIWNTGYIVANCTVKFTFICSACLPSKGSWWLVFKR